MEDENPENELLSRIETSVFEETNTIGTTTSFEVTCEDIQIPEAEPEHIANMESVLTHQEQLEGY